MTVYGWEPPWVGHSAFGFGWWERGEEMWDGSGYVWTLQAPVSSFTQILGLLPSLVNAHKVAWLEDQFLPQVATA